ncbi:MAG: efflux RND transporter periplasmic adaptor subunit [Bacteroidota bacterium]
MNKIQLVFSIGIFLFLVSCQSEVKEKEVQVKLLVTNPIKLDTIIIKDYVCQIHAIQHIDIRALEKGYLEKIYVKEGQLVRKGQIMFQIMPMVYTADVQKSKAEADFARIEYENTKSLADNNVVSKNELALAKAKYDKAKAELMLAKVHLGFTEIRAPFDGIMDRFQVRVGSLIDEGDLLTTLSDNSKMWVYFNVPEVEYLNFMTHSKKDNIKNVNLLMANNEIYEFPGIVETIEADFNNETGNIAFRADFSNKNGLLRHGETGSIRMKVPYKNALIIPQKATFEILEKKYVYVVSKDNVVHTREIQLAAEMPDLFIIKGGLRENERILLEGIRKVNDGDKISFNYEKPKKVISELKVYSE